MKAKGTPVGRAPRAAALVGTLSLTSFTTALNGQVFAPILPQVAHDLDATPAEVGQLVTVSALAGAALALIAGPLSDRYGRRPTLLIGFGVLILTSLGAAAAPDFEVMLVVRLLSGVGSALLGPGALASVADFIPEERQPQAMGWVVGASAVSIVIGWPAIAAITAAASWRVAFLVLVLLMVLLALLVYAVVPERRPTGSRPSLLGQVRRYREVLTDGRVVLAVVASGAAAAAWFGLTTYLGAFFQTTLGLSLADEGPIFTAVGLSYFAASVSGGFLAAKLGVRPVAVASGGATALLLLLLVGAGRTVPLAVALVILLAAMRAGGLTSISSLIMGLRPAERGTVAGLNSLTFSVGISAGAGLGGAALALGGFPLLGISLAALAAVSAGLLLREARRA